MADPGNPSGALDDSVQQSGVPENSETLTGPPPVNDPHVLAFQKLQTPRGCVSVLSAFLRRYIRKLTDFTFACVLRGLSTLPRASYLLSTSTTDTVHDSVVRQRVSVAIAFASSHEIAQALGMSVATDPRGQ